jgi:ABC-type polysaccharide/polyol phosphate transport system ATPase subunit
MKAGTIRLQGVGKRFTKYEDTPTLAYGLLHAFGRSRRSALWAIRDVDLDVEPGEAVGVVGRNGSGKSTLLQMLCGVTAPTTGEVRVSGRIAPLISVGVGFHPELTGRENVFVNGTILGLTRREISSRLDEIVAFSGIEEFIDTPVKFYSSGMYVRLGFSVAAHVDPDVLLIDEVLAVGDLGFQMKCFQHMARLRESGTTILIVSHNIAAMEQYCERGILIDRGSKLFDGPITSTVGSYYEQLGEDPDAGDQTREGDPTVETGMLDVTKCEVLGEDGSPQQRFESGDLLTIRVHLRALTDINAPFMSMSVLAGDGVCVYHDHNVFRPFPALAAGERAVFEASCRLGLTTGSYALKFAVGRGSQHSRNSSQLLDDSALLLAPRRVAFYVRGSESAKGLADLRASFIATPEEESQSS